MLMIMILAPNTNAHSPSPTAHMLPLIMINEYSVYVQSMARSHRMRFLKMGIQLLKGHFYRQFRTKTAGNVPFLSVSV